MYHSIHGLRRLNTQTILPNMKQQNADNIKAINKSWLVDPKHYKNVLPYLGMTDSEYLGYANVLFKVFDPNWLKIQAEEMRGKNYVDESMGFKSLGPVHQFVDPRGEELLHHHLPCILDGHTRSVPSGLSEWCQLITFGQELWISKKSLESSSEYLRFKERLRNHEQYDGARFEIEVLAQLVEANFNLTVHDDTPDFIVVHNGIEVGIEATRRKQMFIDKLRQSIDRLIGLYENILLQNVVLTLKIKDNKKVCIPELYKDIEKIILSRKKNHIETEFYNIGYDSTPLKPEISVNIEYESFGDPVHVLGFTAANSLSDKFCQFKKKNPKFLEAKGRAWIALDLGGLLPSIPLDHAADSDYMPERFATLQKQIDYAISSIQKWTDEHNKLGGVLLWLPRVMKWSQSKVDTVRFNGRRQFFAVLPQHERLMKIQNPAQLVKIIREALL